MVDHYKHKGESREEKVGDQIHFGERLGERARPSVFSLGERGTGGAQLVSMDESRSAGVGRTRCPKCSQTEGNRLENNKDGGTHSTDKNADKVNHGLGNFEGANNSGEVSSQSGSGYQRALTMQPCAIEGDAGS